MGLSFDEFAEAVDSYPHVYLNIEIIDISLAGRIVNVGQEGTFRVRVTYQGPPVLSETAIRIDGLNGALVRSEDPAAVFATQVVVPSSQLRSQSAAPDGRRIRESDHLWIRAPFRPQPSRTLLRADLHGWDADLTSLLLGRAVTPGSVRGTFSAEVGSPESSNSKSWEPSSPYPIPGGGAGLPLSVATTRLMALEQMAGSISQRQKLRESVRPRIAAAVRTLFDFRTRGP